MDATMPRVHPLDSLTTKQDWIRAKEIFWSIYLGPGRWTARVLPGLLRQGSRFLPIARAVGGPARERFVEYLSRYPALHAGPGSGDRLSDQHLAHAFRRALDDLLLERHPVERVVSACQLKGQEHLEAALAYGRGVVLSTGHFFASRLAKRWMGARGWPVLSVRDTGYDDPRVGRLAGRFWQQRYFRFLHRVIEDEVSTRDPECSLKMLARLRAGGIVDIHLDTPFVGKGRTFDFLGKPTPFPAGFMDIVHVAGSAVVPMLCLGSSRGLAIEFLPPMTPRETPREEILEGLVRTLESQVLAHPEQWEQTLSP
jgi:lauroyl/myristoyl acyltransferase